MFLGKEGIYVRVKCRNELFGVYQQRKVLKIKRRETKAGIKIH